MCSDPPNGLDLFDFSNWLKIFLSTKEKNVCFKSWNMELQLKPFIVIFFFFFGNDTHWCNLFIPCSGKFSKDFIWFNLNYSNGFWWFFPIIIHDLVFHVSFRLLCVIKVVKSVLKMQCGSIVFHWKLTIVIG